MVISSLAQSFLIRRLWQAVSLVRSVESLAYGLWQAVSGLAVQWPALSESVFGGFITQSLTPNTISLQLNLCFADSEPRNFWICHTMAKNRPTGVTIWLAKLLNLNSPIWISLLNTLSPCHPASNLPSKFNQATESMPVVYAHWALLRECYSMKVAQWRPLEESHLWVNSESQWAHFEMLYRRLLVDSSRFNLWIGHAALLKCICNSSKIRAN